MREGGGTNTRVATSNPVQHKRERVDVRCPESTVDGRPDILKKIHMSKAHS